jgi:hypothetical protein
VTTEYPVYTGMKTAGPALVQWLGFVVAAIALPVFLIGGLSLEGYAVGLVLFAANRLSAVLIDRLARGKMQVTAVGISGMGFMSRAWISFGLLIAYAELVSRNAAVVGAISFLVYFTVDMLARALSQVAGSGVRGAPPQETK